MTTFQGEGQGAGPLSSGRSPSSVCDIHVLYHSPEDEEMLKCVSKLLVNSVGVLLYAFVFETK